MHIVFVCDTMNAGGAERVISNLANGFSQSNHQVTIVMIGRGAKGSFYDINSSISLVSLFEIEKKISFLKRYSILKKALIKLQPSIVISLLSYVCIYTWLALRHTKIPYIVSERNDPNQRPGFKQFLLNLSFKRASGCAFQTDDALQWYSKINLKKSCVIHNPVNIDVNKKSSERNNTILFIGRLEKQKNCLMLLEAFKLFSKIHNDYILKIYGSGPQKKEILDFMQTNALQDKVLMLDPDSRWMEKEAGAAMLVLSSDYEGMPNVLAEGLSLGLPCVSTNCTIGGPKELSKFFPDSLFLAKTGDTNDFCDKMCQASNKKPESPHIPKELQIDFIVAQWISFIELVLNKHE